MDRAFWSQNGVRITQFNKFLTSRAIVRAVRQFAASLETIHVNLYARRDHFSEHVSFLYCLGPDLTSLRRIVINEFMEIYGEWWAPKPGDIKGKSNYTNGVIRGLVGVDGRYKFVVSRDGSKVQKVIKPWTWEAEEGQVFNIARRTS